MVKEYDSQLTKGLASLFLFFIFVVLVLYLLITLHFQSPIFMTEKSKTGPWHKNNESENRFGALVTFLFFMFLLFAYDSPLGFVGNSYPISAVFVVILTTFAIFHYDRYLTKKELTKRAPYLPRVDSISLVDKEAGKSKFNTIEKCLERLDFSFITTKLISQHDIVASEQTVFSILELTSKEELNYIVTNLNLALLFYKVKDGDVMVPAKSSTNRTKIMELLAVTRLNELDIPARVVLLDALQKMRLCAHPKSEEWVEHIFISTHGIKLILLKTAFDARGSSRNLHQLIWVDISVKFRRELIIKHIQKEGQSYLDQISADEEKYKQYQLHLKELVNRPQQNMYNYNYSSSLADEYEHSWSNFNEFPCRLSLSRSISPITGDDYFDHMQNKYPHSSISHIPTNFIGSLPADNFLRRPSLSHSSDYNYLHPHPHIVPAARIGMNQFEHHMLPAHNLLMPPPLPVKRKMLRKILSDVDDTLFCSAGKFPAGLDKRYMDHQLYPGVLEFYKELDLGPDNPCSESGFWNPVELGNLVFLSARPHLYKDKTEKSSIAAFETIRKKHGMYQVPTLLAGSIDSGMKMFAGDYKPIALMKFQNFDEYAQLYSPEHSFCFIGDNGQADVIAAELMIGKYTTKFEASFIHQVQPLKNTPGIEKYYPKEAKSNSLQVVSNTKKVEKIDISIASKAWNDQKIYFFVTYIGAAVQAYQHGLIHVNGLKRVALAAIKEFKIFQADVLIKNLTVGALPNHITILSIEDRRSELNRDIIEVNNILKLFQIPTVTLIDAINIKVLGSYITFPPFNFTFKIIDFRGIDGMYFLESVDLNFYPRTQNKSFRIFTKNYNNFITFIKGKVRSRVMTAFGTGVITKIRPTDGIHEIELAQNLGELFCLADSFYVIAAARGDKVVTPYGLGVIVAYCPNLLNRNMGTYEVQLLYSTNVPNRSTFSSPTLKSFSPNSNSSTLKTLSLITTISKPKFWGTAYLNQANIKLVDEKSKPSSRCIVM